MATKSPTSVEPDVDFGMKLNNTEEEIGSVTPPPWNCLHGPSNVTLPMPTYLKPLFHYSSVNGDFDDTTWMVDFQDFTSLDSFDDANSDWIIDDDSLVDLASEDED